MEDVILYFACKYFGDWERIYDALEKQEDIDFEEVEELKERYKDQYTTVLSDDYPDALKHIDRPPFVIFYKGNKKLLEAKNKIWYFGSYYNDDYNDEAQEHKVQMEKENIVMITGYTNDFERRLVNNVKPEGAIIVRDSGIDSYINMTRIEEELFMQTNLLVSEYPDKVIPSLYSWETSNKIKSGLVDGMFLLNSLKEKMTFKLIADTIDEKREIFCYNKDIDNKSHNSILINKGAYAIEEIKEVKIHG